MTDPKLIQSFTSDAIGFVTGLISVVLTDEETERVIKSLRSLHENLRKLSSQNLQKLGRDQAFPKAFCKHRGNCSQNCLRGFFKTFAVSYGIKYLVAIAPAVLTLRMLKKPSILRKHLGRDTISFALFLATFTSSYKALLCFLRRKLSTPKTRLVTFAAGSLAGLSILLDKNSSRRTAIALYAFTRCSQFLTRSLMKKWREYRLQEKDKEEEEEQERLLRSDSGFGTDSNALTKRQDLGALPSLQRLKDYSFSDKLDNFLCKSAGTIIMMLSSSQILYSFIAEPESLNPQYYSFLLTHSGRRDDLGKFTRPFMERTGQLLQLASKHPVPVKMPLEDLSTPQAVLVKEGLELWSRRPSSQSSIDKLIDENVIQKFCSQQYKFALCTLIHPETPSCTGYGLLCWWKAMRRSAGLYAPLNAIMILVYSWKKMLKQPHTYLLRFIKSTIRSSLFLSLYVTIAWVSTCYQRRLLGRDKLPIYFINGMLSGLCVLIEPPGRRLELGLYVMPRALESAYKCLVQYSYIPSPSKTQSLPMRLISTVLTQKRFGEPLYFCLATGVLMALYETEQDSITDGYRKVLVRLFGVN